MQRTAPGGNPLAQCFVIPRGSRVYVQMPGEYIFTGVQQYLTGIDLLPIGMLSAVWQDNSQDMFKNFVVLYQHRKEHCFNSISSYSQLPTSSS